MDMESSAVESIFRVIDKLKATVEKVQSKIVEINKKIYKFKQNALLDTNSVDLSFQISLLNNEKSYYSELMRTIETKLFADLSLLYEKVLMLITSLETLDIEHDEEKNNIILNVRKFARPDTISCTEVISLASCTFANLDLINKFVGLFSNYIQTLQDEHKQQNIHCAHLTVTLTNRKNHIEIEHRRYSQELDDLIGYFVDCTKSVARQLEHQDLLLFLTLGNEGHQQR
jgi:hypothetical protein